MAVDPDVGGTGIYRREIEGQVFTFENFDTVSMIDNENKSLWDKANS